MARSAQQQSIKLLELIGWRSPKNIRLAHSSVKNKAQIEGKDKDGPMEASRASSRRVKHVWPFSSALSAGLIA